MVRRKAARKSGLSACLAAPLATPARTFPADRLPSELIHMVFAYLAPTEAAAFRWAGKVVAEVGLQYLAPTVYLRLKEESYDRLLAIAEHPVVSKSVKRLDYEADTLEVRTREEWELLVLGPARLLAMRGYSKEPEADASDRDWRAFNRAMTIIETTPRHAFTKPQMDLAFSIYRKFCADQQYLRQQDFFPQKVAQALKNMCNIKRVSSSSHTSDVSSRYVAEIDNVLGRSHFNLGPGEGFANAARAPGVAGISLMQSIFRGVDQADIQLETFCDGNTNWRIFEHDNKDFETLKKSARSLKKLILKISIYVPLTSPVDSSMWLEAAAFGACVDKGRLLDFLMSAPDLTYMKLNLVPEKTFGVMSLEYIVSDFHWSSLQFVNLSCLAVEEEHLLGFCCRHSATLKYLGLGYVFVKGGSWFSMFHSMRQMLKLEDATIYGTLSGGGIGIWEMEPHAKDDEDTYYTPGYVLRQYLVENVGEDLSLEEYLEVLGIA